MLEASRSNGPVIEELDTDDDDGEVERNGEGDFGENRQKIWSSSWANRNPVVEHPEDLADATTTRQTGSDGRVWEETKHADVTTGEATHTISRGIHDKGHTLTRKLKSDGKVDTMETLHNLEEDELVGFNREWKCNANKHLPGWNIRRNYNAGSTGDRDSPFREGFGLDVMARPSGAIQKKVVTINIE
nr:uncharacterized protein LOC109149034 [Ipomoea batatas]